MSFNEQAQGVIRYFRDVLGVKTVIWPSEKIEPTRSQENMNSAALIGSISTTGDVEAPILKTFDIRMLYSSGSKGPQSLDLITKILAALKVREENAMIFDVSNKTDQELDLVKKIESSYTVCFGFESWLKLYEDHPILGELQNGRICTHAVEEMLQNPEIKKPVWQHLKNLQRKSL